MTILDKIIAQKQLEIAERKAVISTKILEAHPNFNRKTILLKQRLLAPPSGAGGAGIIAEFKRKSPSKGIINDKLTVYEVTKGYAEAGAAGLSVLTDEQFFGGCTKDILKARAANPTTPILRKDFIIAEYQLLEARAFGADVILLIAANLTPERVKDLAKFAKNLNLEVLLEVHDKYELEAYLCEDVDIVGVNNRNLKNFAEQNVNASLELANLIPAQYVKISESCISQPETIRQLQAVGYQGFLIGETFMKTENPAKTMREFIAKI
jgi:indole-3-glycerol phosphate synthase